MTLGNWIKNREQIGRPCFSYDEVKVAFPMLSPNVLSSLLSRYRIQCGDRPRMTRDNSVICDDKRGFFYVFQNEITVRKILGHRLGYLGS